jgi:hypothetical protein
VLSDSVHVIHPLVDPRKVRVRFTALTMMISRLVSSYHSGIPLAQLDSAFAGKSCGRLNKLLAVFWNVPEVARELSLLFGGKQTADAKYKRIKPIFERARKSASSSSSAPLPLDATEPRLELELRARLC